MSTPLKRGLPHKPAFCFRGIAPLPPPPPHPPVQGSRKRLCKLSEMMQQRAQCKSVPGEGRLPTHNPPLSSPPLPQDPLITQPKGFLTCDSRNFSIAFKVFPLNILLIIIMPILLQKEYILAVFQKIQISMEKDGEKLPMITPPKDNHVKLLGVFSFLSFCGVKIFLQTYNPA